MAAVGQALLAIWFIGLVSTWTVLYFSGGFRTVRRLHGVDWRQFGPVWWFGRQVLWPYYFYRWYLRRESGYQLQAVVMIDGREVRDYVSTGEYDIEGGVATTRSTSVSGNEGDSTLG